MMTSAGIFETSEYEAPERDLFEITLEPNWALKK